MSPIKVAIDDNLKPPVKTWNYAPCFISFKSPRFSLNTVGKEINDPSYLHFFDQDAEARLLQITLQIEGTTDSSVGDHGFEDLGTVDLLPLPLALSQHMSGGGERRGGERVAGER